MHDREQHLLEAACDMWADRPGNKSAAQGGRAATDRDGEVVGPKPDEALAERRRRSQRGNQRGARVLAVDDRPAALAGRRLVLPVEPQCVEGAFRRGGRTRRLRIAELVLDPGRRIAGERLLPRRPRPKRINA